MSGATGTLPTDGAVEFRYTQTESFVALLHELGATLLVSTYQANKLLVARATVAGMSMLVRTFDRPMGIAVDTDRLTIGTRNQVWILRNAPDIATRVEPAGHHDACYLPRSCHVTGDIGVHELAWADKRTTEVRDQSSDSRISTSDLSPLPSSSAELWIVNTRFSCLCTLHPDYSFVPRWRPPFITALAAEDRCHLNGLAMSEGRPKYVTALGETDTGDGWRPAKSHGGCLIDVPSGEIVAHGISMPHSPRLHHGRLWLLESGTGQLMFVEVQTGQLRAVVELPGFVRGLATHGPYAFIGLSKIRESSAMNGVPLTQRRDQLKCGVAAIDLRSGRIVGLLEFHTAVQEIFDVQLLTGLRFPEVIGFQKDQVHHTFIVPRDQQSSVQP